jgi:hypothetical protein
MSACVDRDTSVGRCKCSEEAVPRVSGAEHL